MQVTIIVDNRETKLYQVLQNLCQTCPSIQLTQAVLDIADVHIQCTDPEIKLFFERKTIADLAASIKDSRYQEQKYRMLSALPPQCITYVIEGATISARSEHGLNRSVYLGMYMHTMYRDGMHVVFTKNTDETAQWIYDVANKLQKNPEKFLQSQGGNSNDYISTRKAKMRKIDNMTPQYCYLMQLSQIPGVSLKLAEAIAQVYPSFYRLCDTFEKCASDSERIALLAKIPLIGQKKAAVIVDYLRNQVDTPAEECRDLPT